MDSLLFSFTAFPVSIDEITLVKYYLNMYRASTNVSLHFLQIVFSVSLTKHFEKNMFIFVSLFRNVYSTTKQYSVGSFPILQHSQQNKLILKRNIYLLLDRFQRFV